jgi:hypothetical protein
MNLNVRNSYLTKLMNQGYMSPEPRKKYRHCNYFLFIFNDQMIKFIVFVFDWDDTFLCTTYLNHMNFN